MKFRNHGNSLAVPAPATSPAEMEAGADLLTAAECAGLREFFELLDEWDRREREGHL